MSIERRQRGLLAHSAKAGEARREFMAMRRTQTTQTSDIAQLKYFLLYSRAGMTSVFVLAAIMFYAGIGG